MSLFRGLGFRKDATRGTTPIEVRKSLAGLFSSTGVMPGGPSPLLTGTAGWAYTVAGPAWFVASRGPSDGVALYGNDGAAVIGTTGVGSTVPVAPGAGLQRIDIAWTRHPTNGENADTSSEPMFGVASGTAASSSPVAPTIPAGAIELGRNTMTSAATSTSSAGNTITQSAPVAVLRGNPAVSTKRTGPAGPYSAMTDGIVLAPAVVGDGAKMFKISASFYSLAGSVPGDRFEVLLKDSTLGSTLVARSVNIPASGWSDGTTVTTTDVPAAGSHVYGLSSVRVGGTGVATMYNLIEIIAEPIA